MLAQFPHGLSPPAAGFPVHIARGQPVDIRLRLALPVDATQNSAVPRRLKNMGIDTAAQLANPDNARVCGNFLTFRSRICYKAIQRRETGVNPPSKSRFPPQLRSLSASPPPPDTHACRRCGEFIPDGEEPDGCENWAYSELRAPSHG